MKPAPVIDVAAPPDRPFSQHAPIWWGNAFVLTIEGAGFAVLIAIYFYIRHTSDTWPPTGTLVPDLGVSTLNVAILVVSILPMLFVVRLALRRDKSRAVGVGLLACVLFGIVAAILRVLEFMAVHTRWNTNAYGSIVWSILAVHFAHIVAATLGTLTIAIAMLSGSPEEKHYTDIAANAVYWYFVALSWVALYTIVFLSPRFL